MKEWGLFVSLVPFVTATQEIMMSVWHPRIPVLGPTPHPLSTACTVNGQMAPPLFCRVHKHMFEGAFRWFWGGAGPQKRLKRRRG